MGLQIVTPPLDYPITLEEAKAQLSVDFDDDDDKITQYIAAATQALDGPYGWLGRAIMPQTWNFFRDSFPSSSMWGSTGVSCCPCSTMGSMAMGCNGIELPLPPLVSVSQIAYADPADPNTYLTLDPSLYAVDNAGYTGWVQTTDTWPSAASSINAIRITFVAGYATVPADIKQVILMLVRDWYDQPGSYVVGASVSECPRAVDALLNGYRVHYL